MTKKSLIIGGDGLIGSDLKRRLEFGQGIVYSTSRKRNNDSIYFDLSAPNLSSFQFPEVDNVFICAGMSKFRDCEEHRALAQRINCDAPAEIAARFSHTDAHVILLSTSAVFDGKYAKVRTDTLKAPVSTYGITKANGEDAVLRMGKRVSIVRLTKIVHEGLPIFQRWSESLRNKEVIRAYTDMYFCPILMQDLTRSLIAVALSNECGIFHVSGEEDITYYEAALALASTLGLSADLVEPYSSIVDGIKPEHILRHTSLDTSGLPIELGFVAPSSSKVLNNVFAKFL